MKDSSENFRKFLARLYNSKSRNRFCRFITRTLFLFCWIIYSKKIPTLTIDSKKNAFPTQNWHQRSILTNHSYLGRIINIDRICQNILILDDARSRRFGGRYQALRTNLNSELAKSLVVKECAFDQLNNYLKEIERSTHSNWGIPHEFYKREPSSVLGFALFDSDSNLVATSAGFFTQDIFNIQYLVTLSSEESLIARWVLHEVITQAVMERGFTYIRISNPYDMTLNNLYFNRRLGYCDVNLA